MLPSLYTKKTVPIIISEPLKFSGSWCYTTDSYLNFYKNNFNFHFLATKFKNEWCKI